MKKDIVQDALEWFEPLTDQETLWTFDKVYYVFINLDKYDFEDQNVKPLIDIINKHKTQILAETTTLPFIKDYRAEHNVSRKRFWWWIDNI